VKIDKSGFLKGVALYCLAQLRRSAAGSGVRYSAAGNPHISLPPRSYGGPGVIDFFTNQLDIWQHPLLRDDRASQGFAPIFSSAAKAR